MPEARRTIVKSPPELWAEISDPDALGRHLEAFGEIRITRLEPETTVAWEGERASGTVALAPSGWGTKVIVTADAAEPLPPEPAPAPVEEPEPVEAPPQVPPAAEAAPRRGFLARLFRRRPKLEVSTVAESEPTEPPLGPEPEVEDPAGEPEPAPEPVREDPAHEAALVGMLDALGQAHHRPFSRG